MRQNHLKNISEVLGGLLIFYCEITKEFLNITVINGLKYLTFKYLTIWEKLFFLSCFIAAFCNSFNFAMSIIEKWQTSPVITSMNPRISYITKEPFPAITICNMNQAQYSKVKDFNGKSSNYAMLQKLCFQEINYTSFGYNQEKGKIDSFSSFIVKNTQSCSQMLDSCKYGNLQITCSDLFREYLLDEGMCCSFNIVHPYMLYKKDYLITRDYTTVDGLSIPIDWSPERGYPKNLPQNFYPRMALGPGISNGLTIVLNGDLDNYHCSSTNGAGFKVSLHNPIDTPNVKETGLTVSLGYQTNFRITTLKEEADDSLRTLVKPKKRHCYFSNEYILFYFRYYSRINCEMECDAHFMLRKCHCLQYHMPVISHNFTECHVRHFDCVLDAEKDYVDEILVACRKECLPNCNELSYFSKSSFTLLNHKSIVMKNTHLRNLSKESLNNYAELQVYFPANYYRGTVRRPYIGFTEFLSLVGGIMSLMMGFSVISIVEMVYFFIIKPLIYAWRKVFYSNTVEVMQMESNTKGYKIHIHSNAAFKQRARPQF